MQRKLKSVFRRSSRSRSSSGQHQPLESNTYHTEAASSPRADRHRVSSDRHGRTSVDSSATDSAYTGRSRPVSSVYDDRRHSQQSARPATATDFASSTDPVIANDYKGYLPALSPVNDDHGDEYITPSGGRRHVTEQHAARHEEDVADRNIARYSSSIDGGNREAAGVLHNGSAAVASGGPAVNTGYGRQHVRKQSVDAGSIGSNSGSVRTGGPVRKPSFSQGVTTKGALADGIRPHTETSSQKDTLNRPSSPTKAARVEPGRERRRSRMSGSGIDAPHSLREPHQVHGTQSDVRHATVDGTAHGEETALARNLREAGIADLRNTVDTDGDITWASAVTHEVIKPHEHEIIQHKIYREIHNYEHFHRIQPVMMTEVLPPRHWIPNPKGEGLIEISAEELPARTGENRWWSICEQSSPWSLQKNTPKYRTEPEIIEAGTFMTEEGFERKETIIIHPPTIADLTGYGGPVQAVHFDHKTGKSWMGELTTMDKLRELQQELDRAPDSQAFNMNGLSKDLPDVPPKSTLSTSARRGSTSMPLRKPVSGRS